LQKIGHMTKPEIYETTRPLAPMKAYMDKACTQHRHHGHPCAQLWPTRPDGPLTFKGSGEPCGISSVTMPTSFLLSNAPSQQPQAVVKPQPTDRIFGASLRPHQRISILRTINCGWTSFYCGSCTSILGILPGCQSNLAANTYPGLGTNIKSDLLVLA
jgi:hypothetical protein